MSMDEFRRHLVAALECEVSQKIGAKLCPASHLGMMHDFWIKRGYACPGCKAAL